MLKSLALIDFALAKNVEFDPSAGFVALTGETGAGKSLLIDALGLALGARAEGSWVRQGRPRAQVSAIFTASQNALDWLNERSIAAEDGEVSLRRVIEAAGRSKSWINGVAVSASELKELGRLLAVIHGQHESVALLDPKAQRALVDQQAGLGAKLSRLGGLFEEWKKSKAALASARSRREELDRARSQLAWEADELERLNPRKGEWEELEQEQKMFSQSEAMMSAAQAALSDLEEGESPALAALSRHARALEAFGRSNAACASIAEALRSAHTNAQEAARDLGRFAREADFSAERAAEVEARLSALYQCARKLRAQEGALWERAQSVRKSLDELDASVDEQALLQSERQSWSEYEQAALEIRRLRLSSSTELCEKASAMLEGLGMASAKIEPQMSPKEPGPEGMDALEIYFSPHTGAKPLPLGKCASGGELSRVSLALSVCGDEFAQPGCMVFDEVDAGVGGPSALLIGRLMSRVGARSQALAVTHLPQVAACAQRQHRVGKSDVKGEWESYCQALGREERVLELARMLGGEEQQSARDHAEALLRSAGLAAEQERQERLARQSSGA